MSGQNSGKQRGRPFKPGQSGNPKGRPRRADAASRTDGWHSLVTGHGTSRDRATTFRTMGPRLPYEVLREVYRDDGTAARVVDLLPGEMLRKGIDVGVRSQDGIDGQEVQQALIDRLDELHYTSRVKLALQWARAFGGSAILLGANDGSPDLSIPLNLDRVVSLDWLTVLTCRELQPATWYDSPRHPKYGEPSTYNIIPMVPTDGGGMQRVHESRLLRFDGVKLTREEERANQGWGDSVLQRMYDTLRDAGAAWSGAAHLLSEYGQGVLTIPGLLEMTRAAEGGSLDSRLVAFETMRSTVRSIVLDGGAGDVPGETFTRLQTPLSGLADMFDRFEKRLSALSGVPVSLLTGESPSGLNASGGVNASWWEENVAAAREELLRPPTNRIVKILLKSKTGPTRGVEPESWRVVFPPLRELTAKEKADIRLVDAQADEIHTRIGALDPTEVAFSAYAGAEYSSDRTIDLDTRDALASDDEPLPGEELPTVGAGQPGTAEPAAAAALDGAQVAALVNIISQVAQRQIPRESGIGIVLASLPLTESQAEAIMGEAGRGFVPSLPGEAGAST